MVGKEKLVFLPTLLHEYLILSSGIAMVLVKILAILVLAIGLPKKYWEHSLAFVKEKFRSEITKEARIYLLIYIVFIALLWQYPRILLGFGLGIALAHSFLAVYLMAEHTGLPTEGSVLNKGRSMQTHRFVRFFMWNMPYHVEHHAYPSVPFHAIPQLHDLLAEYLPHQEKGYLPFHWKVIKKLKLF
ncbi:MAG: fatty acid desaturase, partial [Bacteroidia bacterium]